MKKNLEWNVKAINSLIFDVWAPKVGNKAKQEKFFRMVEKARDKEKAAKEEEQNG